MISVTEILGTDSISASRLVINDNFMLLKDEINSIETYLDPGAGAIDGLNNIQAAAIQIGPSNTPYLKITPTTFNIDANLIFEGLLTINGKLAINNSISITSTPTTPLDLDAASAADTYVIYNEGSDITIQLGEANPGQEVTFVYSQAGNGVVTIKAATDVEFNFGSNTGGAADEIILNDVGSTVKLKYVEEGVGTYAFYIIGGHNYTVQ